MKVNMFNGQISGRKKLHTKDKIRFDCHPGEKIKNLKRSDVELMKFGFD